MNNTLSFDGKTSYVVVPGLESPTSTTGAITIEFWNKAGGGTAGHAFWFVAEDGAQRLSCHAPWSDGKLYWDCGAWDESDGRLTVPYPASPEKWTHVALVSGGASDEPGMAVYLDGELAGSTATSSVPGTLTGGLVIGARTDPTATTFSGHHLGLIDEFRIWNRVRTAEEIKRDMRAQLIGDESGLVACFDFNWGFQDYTGDNLWGDRLDMLPNSVPNGVNGVLHNFTPSSWTAGGVTLTAPVGPVYRLRSADGTRHVHTARPAEHAALTTGGWVDDGIAFHAHRAAAPGTVPLFRLHHSATGRYLLTSDPAERAALDPRTSATDAPGEWTDEGEIAFVSSCSNGRAVPLYRSRAGADAEYSYTTDAAAVVAADPNPSVECFVLQQADDHHAPDPIAFLPDGRSEHLWYVLLCLSETGDDHGLQVVQTGLRSGHGERLAVQQLPADGPLEQFQWRFLDGRLLNRDTGLVLTIAGGSASPRLYADDPVQKVTAEPLTAHGTDRFRIVRDGQALSARGGSIGTVGAGTAGASEEWTLLATEPVHGYTIPAPPASHSALPYAKYFPLRGMHILGTGTVSDWAMLRVRLVLDNMLNAVTDQASLTHLADKEIFVVSRDDSAAELAHAPCIGMAFDESTIADLRGSAGAIGSGSFCYFSEELMWKTGVFNRPKDATFRRFDQVVHEFAHLMDHVLGFDGDHFPVPSTYTAPAREELAGKVQSWFSSIGTVVPTFIYSPGTRAEMQTGYPDQYTRLARLLDPANPWTPPREFRTSPWLPQPTAYLVAIGRAAFRFEKDREYFSTTAGRCAVRFQSDGNFVVYDGTPRPVWSAPVSLTWSKATDAVFTADGDLTILDATTKILWHTATGGNPGARLHLDDAGVLRVEDARGTVLWRSSGLGAAR